MRELSKNESLKEHKEATMIDKLPSVKDLGRYPQLAILDALELTLVRFRRTVDYF